MSLRVAIAAVLLLLAGYGVLKALPLVEGPQISLKSPAADASIQGGFVAVTGVARHTQNLSLDGAPLLIDPQGAFSTTLVLPTGSAILSLTATDRFGKSQTVRRMIYVP